MNTKPMATYTYKQWLFDQEEVFLTYEFVRHNGNSGQTAKALNLSRMTLRKKLKAHGLIQKSNGLTTKFMDKRYEKIERDRRLAESDYFRIPIFQPTNTEVSK